MGAIRLRHEVPANEADFELLCLDLLKADWNNKGLTLYATRGEEQFGVDIIDLGGEEPLSAAQCKRHNPSKTIPPAEIKKEVEKAERFSAKLGRYTILTTAKASKKAHDAILEINRRHSRDGLFRVELLTWESIERLLDKHSSVWDEYYATISGRKANEMDLKLAAIQQAVTSGPQNRGPAADSGTPRADEGFRVAVLPFKSTDASADLTALADGLTGDIITGMSRFSYLRIIARRSTLHYANQRVDPRVAGQELGARFVMEGTLHQEGSILRLEVQVVDAATNAHLRGPNYECAFNPKALFKLRDDLVPRIVSTVADAQGILAQTMGESLRNRAPDQLTPYEAVLRSFVYFNRLNEEEHGLARAALEAALAKAPEAPGQSDAWAWLAIMYREEYVHGFNLRPKPLDRAHAAALRAIDFESSNHWAHLALASVLYYQREIPAFQSEAKKAIDFNPMDGTSMAYLASLLAVSGAWKRGCALMRKAQSLNPSFPGWYWIPAIGKAYRDRDYRRALNLALKINMPDLWISQFLLAAIYGQLGELRKAQKALEKLLALRPKFASEARKEFAKRYEQEFLDRLIEGLRMAGMEIAQGD
jgi:TolB-like protein